MYGREGNTLHCLLGMENKSVQYKLFNSKVTATISVSMVLFLLGIVAAVLFMSKNLSDQVKENFIFKLTLKEVVPDKDIVSIQRALQSKPYVKSVRFVSKDVAVKELKQQMGEDPMEFCDVNPLPNCFEISLKANQTQPDSLKLIQADLMHITQISQIDYSHELLDTFTHNIKAITVAFLLVAAVLLLISFTLNYGNNDSLQRIHYSAFLFLGIHNMANISKKKPNTVTTGPRVIRRKLKIEGSKATPVGEPIMQASPAMMMTKPTAISIRFRFGNANPFSANCSDVIVEPCSSTSAD